MDYFQSQMGEIDIHIYWYAFSYFLVGRYSYFYEKGDILCILISGVSKRFFLFAYSISLTKTNKILFNSQNQTLFSRYFLV